MNLNEIQQFLIKNSEISDSLDRKIGKISEILMFFVNFTKFSLEKRSFL